MHSVEQSLTFCARVFVCVFSIDAATAAKTQSEELFATLYALSAQIKEVGDARRAAASAAAAEAKQIEIRERQKANKAKAAAEKEAAAAAAAAAGAKK